MNVPPDSADIEKRPITFLEWAGAILGFLALFAEILRRTVLGIDGQSGDLWFNIIIFTSLAVTLYLVLPTLFREWFSTRRGIADHYLALIMVVTISASIYVAQQDWRQHFVGVLPIILAGYAICKNKYRIYQNCLEAVSEKLHKNKLPEVEVINEGEAPSHRPPEAIKAGDILRIQTNERIWVPGIITQGYGSINQTSTQASPIPRRVRTGDTVAPGEILLDGELHVQATQDGKPAFKKDLPRNWQEDYDRLSYNRRQKILRIFWISFVIVILCAQVSFSHADGNWTNAIMPCIALLIGLAPWGYILAMPILWRRRLTETTLNGIKFRHLRLLEILGRPIHLLIEKTGVLTEPGIVRQNIILSKYFRGKSAFIIRTIHSIEKNSELSLGSHYFTRGEDGGVKILKSYFAENGSIEAEVFDPEEHRIFVRVGSLKSMPYYTHNGFKQLSAQDKDQSARQRLFVTLNDIPAAILSWTEILRPEAESLVHEAHKYNLPISIHTLDPLGKINEVGDLTIEKLSSEEEKATAVSKIQTGRNPVLYLGFGRSDLPAMKAASGCIVMDNADPGIMDRADASIARESLAEIPREWLRFCRARRVANNISWITGTHAGVILTLAARDILNPWLATLISAITSGIMIALILRVEKEPEIQDQRKAVKAAPTQ